MKKNVLFSPLFLYNLALITHDATMSVNPSICLAILLHCMLLTIYMGKIKWLLYSIWEAVENIGCDLR